MVSFRNKCGGDQTTSEMEEGRLEDSPYLEIY